jgi:hypothetical protein
MQTVKINDVIHQYEASDPSHHGYDLISATDGFHPSSTSMGLFAQTAWDQMIKSNPDQGGPINPFNDDIAAIFGDQGGY